MKTIITLLLFVAVLFVPTLVVAQPCPPCPPVDVNLSVADQAQEWWMVLLDFLVQLSAPLITAILGVLGAWLVRKLTKKWDVEKQEAMVRLTDGFITSGIAFAEEQARKALRTDKVKTKSADKLQSAVDYIEGQLSSSGVQTIAQDELVKLIESRLQRERSRPDGAIPNDGLPDGEEGDDKAEE
jgi:hypothetical protein